MAFEPNHLSPSFLITKHSWKGRYQRILNISHRGLTTYQPNTFEVTNMWIFSEIVNIEVVKTGNEFNLKIRRQNKNETLKFSSEFRNNLVAIMLMHREKFCGGIERKPLKYSCTKMSWNDRMHSVILSLDLATLYQIHLISGKILAEYHFFEISEILFIANEPNAFIVVEKKMKRMHMFSISDRKEFISALVVRAGQIGVRNISVGKEVSIECFNNHKFGCFSDDNSMTSLSEFYVQKVGNCCRRAILGPVDRILCLAEKALIERDKTSYAAVTIKPLVEVFSIIQHVDNLQMITIEYIYGQKRSYLTTDRDELVCSLLDGVRGAGNKNVCVKTRLTPCAFRACPFYANIDDEMENIMLKGFASTEENFDFFLFVERFNANVDYSGLRNAVTEEKWFALNKEKLITKALEVLVEYTTKSCTPSQLESIFLALRRLIASKAGYSAFTSIAKMRTSIGGSVMHALNVENSVIHASLEMLNALMQPMHENYELYQEQLNKVSITNSKKFMQIMVDKLVDSIFKSDFLVILSILDFFTYIICFPYSETTEQETFNTVLNLLSKESRVLFRLFQSSSPAIVKSVGIILKAIVEEGTEEIALNIQRLALSEGALIRHFYNSFFLETSDGRRLALRQISRYLLSYWFTGSSMAKDLLKRMLPAGLFQYLFSSENPDFTDVDRINIRDGGKTEMTIKVKPPQFYENLEKKISSYLLHWRERVGLPSITVNTKNGDPRVAKLRLRKHVKPIQENWPMLYCQFYRDHSKPNLIWNFKTRDELRKAIEGEISLFKVSIDLSNNANIAWNHQEFSVVYPSLSEEVVINDYYIRILLDSATCNKFTDNENSRDFFNDIYHRFLVSSSPEMKSLCMQSMTVVYEKCFKTIGKFNDIQFIVKLLQNSKQAQVRNQLIVFLEKLVLVAENCQNLILFNGISTLIDLLPLAHLHVNRAVLPTAIKAICTTTTDLVYKDWYYSDANKERHGPYSLKQVEELYVDGVINDKTIFWAQGIDGWRPLITIALIKWTIVCKGNSESLLNYSQLTVYILNILIGICKFYPNRNIDDSVFRPMAKIRVILSNNTILPHIVQLILTFDPVIIENVAVLLLSVIKDNPNLPRLYLTGVFFFFLMYTGSNILPISQFLKYTHVKQAFRSESSCSSFINMSILSPILPEAMIWCLENYTAQEFSKIFIGEFNTPEFIWNTEMRRFLIMNVANHISDFSPRIVSNTHIIYQYLPIARVEYPQLEGEVFCNIYYLRHLTDSQFSHTWEIKDPVSLLKDILGRWSLEIGKKSPKLSISNALDILDFDKQLIDLPELSVIKHRYYQLSQKYHPDKNPEGADMFMKINEAYQFLSERKANVGKMTSRHVLKLLLKTQIILYERYMEILEPFKYAGYSMLVKMLINETSTPDLFEKEIDILPHACELVYHTVKASRLNAQELRREGGLKVLQMALTRSVSVLSLVSKPSDLAVKICFHIAECFCIASSFEEIRELIQEMSSLVVDFLKILHLKQLVSLNTTVIKCLCVFCKDVILQMNLFKHGAMFYVVPNIFNYDYTLNENLTQHTEETNKQLILNARAKQSIVFCACIGGYLTGEYESPINRPGQLVLNGFFTPYVSRKMADNNFEDLLKLLNSNVLTPYMIWDNAVRNQLVAHANSEAQHLVRTGKCKNEYDMEFKLSAHKDELVVGEIFINIYNNQSHFVIESPKAFVLDLMYYLAEAVKYLSVFRPDKMTKVDKYKRSSADLKSKFKTSIDDVLAVLMALYNAINHNPGVEIQLVGHFKVLFIFLNMECLIEAIQTIIDILLIAIGSQICISDISSTNSMESLLFILQIDRYKDCIIVLFTTLLSSKSVLKECLVKGILIYSLDVFCNSNLVQLRTNTAALLAKCMSDKLVGPKVRMILNNFLPAVFMDAMCDSPSTAVQLFDGNHENPELVWNKESRQDIKKTISVMKCDLYKKQKLDSKTRWKLPDSKKPFFHLADGEIIISGVYLRIYILNPGWVLRNPRQFITELLNTWCTLSERKSINGDVFEMVTQGISAFMMHQSGIMDQVPSMGHIPRILKNISCSKNSAVARSGLMIIKNLTINKRCISSLIEHNCLDFIIQACKQNEDIIDVSVDIFRNLFESNNESIAKQALDTNIIPYLLKILEKNSNEFNLKNIGAIRANLVKALKALATSYEYGMDITNLLNSHKVWQDYSQQKHDLFLSNENTPQLEGPKVAGYLMSAPQPSNDYKSEPNL